MTGYDISVRKDLLPVLSSKDGRQLWLVMSDFVYQSDVAGPTITVPEHFVIDFASVHVSPLSMTTSVTSPNVRR